MLYIRAAVRTPVLHGLVAVFVICGTARRSRLGVMSLADDVHEKYGLLGRGQTVAIIDSGIAYDHFALGGGLRGKLPRRGGRDFTTRKRHQSLR